MKRTVRNNVSVMSVTAVYYWQATGLSLHALI